MNRRILRKSNFSSMEDTRNSQLSESSEQMSTDDTTITLTPSDDRIVVGQDFDSGHSQNHGCLAETEKLSLRRSPIGPGSNAKSNPKEWFEKGHKNLLQNNQSNVYSTCRNYIRDAEINSRGYMDRFGRIFYSIPALSKDSGLQMSLKTVNSPAFRKESERSIRAGNVPNVKSESKLNEKGMLGAIRCTVGDDSDHGRMEFQVHPDGRAYNLKCADGRSLILNFSKKVLTYRPILKKSCV